MNTKIVILTFSFLNLFCTSLLCNRNTPPLLIDDSKEDNMTNFHNYKKIIVDTISNSLKNHNLLDSLQGSVELQFAISESGKTEDVVLCHGISETIDTLLVNALSHIDFKEAAVYTYKREAYHTKLKLTILFKLSRYRNNYFLIRLFLLEYKLRQHPIL